MQRLLARRELLMLGRLDSSTSSLKLLSPFWRPAAASVRVLTPFSHAVATVGAGRLPMMVIISMPSCALPLLSCAELTGTRLALNKAAAITVTIVLVFMIAVSVVHSLN